MPPDSGNVPILGEVNHDALAVIHFLNTINWNEVEAAALDLQGWGETANLTQCYKQVLLEAASGWHRSVGT